MTNTVRILLVEDNPADAELISDMLEAGRLNPELSVVKDGVEAIDVLRHAEETSGAWRPDLILLDLNLPRRGGLEVLDIIKKPGVLRSIPVVILTSSDAEVDIARSYDLGANCYVTKPGGLRAFQDVIQSVEDFWFSTVRLPVRGMGPEGPRTSAGGRG